MWCRGVLGAGGGVWWILLASCLLSYAEGAVRRKRDTKAYVIDPVGIPLSRPLKVPAKVGSPAALLQPDRYEFYTFDESGELIKRLMTLREIQEIIATGDGDDGHVLTIAQTDITKPAVTFNFQPPSHTKVHNIVSNVQNVLKAEMEAQKTHPPKENIFDTPDVSSSWSMILPAIFGNTGGSIAPESLISMHSVPETDVITNNKKEETVTEKQTPDNEMGDFTKLIENITESYHIHSHDDDSDDIEGDVDTYSQVEDLIEEELTNFASKTTDSILVNDDDSLPSVASKNPATVQIKMEQTTKAFIPPTEKIISTTSSKPVTMSTTVKSAPKVDKIVIIKKRPVSQTTTERLNTTPKPVAIKSEQITEEGILAEVHLVTRQPVLQVNKNKETATSTKTGMTTVAIQTTTERIDKLVSTKPITSLKVDQTTAKPNITKEKPLFVKKPVNQLNENKISPSTNKNKEIINEKLVERTTTPLSTVKTEKPTELTMVDSNPSTSATLSTADKPGIITEKIIQSAEKSTLVDDTTVKTTHSNITSADQHDKEINITPEAPDKNEMEMNTENGDYTAITDFETLDELEETTTEIERHTKVPTTIITAAPVDLNIKHNSANIPTKGTANTESVTSQKEENTNLTTEKSSYTETTKSDPLKNVPSTTTETESITESSKISTNSETTKNTKEVETTTIKMGSTPSITNNDKPSAQLINNGVPNPVTTVENTEKNNEIKKIKPNLPLGSGVTQIEIEADVKVNPTTQKAVFEKKPVYQFINNQVVNNSLSTDSGLISKPSDQMKKSNVTQTVKTTIKPIVDGQTKIKPVTESTIFVKTTTSINQNKLVIVKESAKNFTKETEEKVTALKDNIRVITVKPVQNEKNQNGQLIGSHIDDINVIATTYKPITKKPFTVSEQTSEVTKNNTKDESVSIKYSTDKLSATPIEKNTTTKTTKPITENILKEELAEKKISGALLNESQTIGKPKVDATTEANLYEQQITRRTTPESSFVKISSSNSNSLLNNPDTKSNVTKQNSNMKNEPPLSTKPIIHYTVTDKPTQNTVEADPGLDIYQILTQISMDLREPDKNYKPENISATPFANIVQDLLKPNSSEIRNEEDIPQESFKTTTQNILIGEQESNSKISTISTTTNKLTSGASVTNNVESTTPEVVKETLSSVQENNSTIPTLSTTEVVKGSVLTFLSESIKKDNISESFVKANASNIAINEHVPESTQSTTAQIVTGPSRLSTTPFAPTEEKKYINQGPKPTTEIVGNLSDSITILISQINDEDSQTTINPITYDEYLDSEENTYTTMDSSYYNDEESTTKEIETDQTTIAPILQTTEKIQDPTTQKIIKSTTTQQTEELKKKPSTETIPAKIVATTVKPISLEVEKITTAKKKVPTKEQNNKDQQIPLLALNQIKVNLNKENTKNEKIISTTETVIQKTTEATKISTKREEPLKVATTTDKIPEKTKTTPSATTLETTKATAITEDDELMEMLNKYSQMFKMPEDNGKDDDSGSPTEPPQLPTEHSNKYKETTNDKLNKETNKKTDQVLKSNSTLINKPIEKINLLNITVTKTGVKDKVNKDNTEIDKVVSSIKKVSSNLQSSQIIKNNTKVAYDKIAYTHAELPNKEIPNNNRLVLRKETLNTEVPVKQNITRSSTKKPEYKVATTSDSIKSNNEIDAINTQLKTLNDLMSTKKETSTLAAIPQTKSEDSTTSKSQVLQEKIDNLSKDIINKTHANENANNSSISEKKNNTDVDSQWKLVPTVYPHNETLKPNTINNRVSIQNIELPLAYQRPQSPQNSVNGLKNYQSQHIGQIHLPGLNGGEGLEKTTAGLSEDVFQFSQLCNELAFRYWNAVSSNGIDPKRSLAVSPFAVTSILAMMFLGARGATSGEMNEILKLDDMVTFNPHIVFKNVTESIEVSKKSGVATSCFIREIFSDRAKGRLLSFYKERVQQFYSGHVEEVNFKVIGDVIRRRTNLLVKRHTWGKIPEYIKANNMILRSPLSIFSANIFQTDCSVASTDGRDGEMYFVVSPTIRQRRLIPVPAVVYRTGFLAGYVPELDATVVAIDKGDQVVSTIFIMPGQQGSTAQGDDIIDLQTRLLKSALNNNTWTTLLKSLIPRQGLELQIPRFSHRSVINGSTALKQMGLKDLFDSENADLRGLNGQTNDLYLSDIMLVNTFSTCGEGHIGDQHHVEVYPGEPNKVQRRLWRSPHRPIIQDTPNKQIVSEIWDEPRDYQRAFHDPLHDMSYLNMPLHLRPRQARLPDSIPEPPRLKFDRPFMFFARHNPTGLILHMGRYNPRLLP